MKGSDSHNIAGDDKFVPHKIVPEAVRLKVEKADNSGTVKIF